jgi:hypothetical protein
MENRGKTGGSGNKEGNGNMVSSGDKLPHACGYEILTLSGIKSGLCSLIGESSLRLRICWLHQCCQGWFSWFSALTNQHFPVTAI